jgi:predicted peptidase
LGYYEYLPPGYGDGDPRPLLVFVHGKDECGDGSLGQLHRLYETGIPALIKDNDWAGDRPFVVLAPQHDCPSQVQHYGECGGGQHYGSCMLKLQHRLGHPVDGSLCMTPSELHEFISYAVPAYDVDPQRVYLTGLSCGAYAAFEYAAEYGATQIAAMVPIAGEGRPAWEALRCELGQVAIWAFHGDADYDLDPDGTIGPMRNVMNCPQPPRQDVELTVYPGVDHDSWTRTYDLSAGHDIYEWLLRFSLA